MYYETKYWVEFFSPGIMFCETWTKKYDNLPNPEDIKWPNNAYAFSIHKRIDITECDKVFKGESEQIGLTYYHPDSKIETLQEVKKNHPTEKTLIRNMESNKWDKVIWTRWGNWPQPYNEDHFVILKPKKEI